MAAPGSITLVPFKVVKSPASCKESICLQDVLVKKNTTESQLKDLIIAISCAHRKNSLQSLGFAPTTPKNPRGPYFAVSVDIFDDPAQMKQLHLLDKYPEAKNLDALYEKYRKNIKASYVDTYISIKNGRGGDAFIGVKDAAAFKLIELPALANCPVITLGTR